jgi:hypothetical protein
MDLIALRSSFGSNEKEREKFDFSTFGGATCSKFASSIWEITFNIIQI